MLQEPALSLIVEAGGRELVNFMEIEEARRHLGGPYAFMGVSVRFGRARCAPVGDTAAGRAALAAGLADCAGAAAGRYRWRREPGGAGGR